MRISKEEEPLRINREAENVNQFKYVESLLTKGDNRTMETRSRIVLAKAVFTMKRPSDLSARICDRNWFGASLYTDRYTQTKKNDVEYIAGEEWKN